MTSRNDSKAATPKSRPNRVLKVDLTPMTMVKAILVVGAAWLLIRLLPALLVLVVALMLVGALNPVVERLEERGIHKLLAIFIVFGLLLIAIFLIITLTVPAFTEEAAGLVDQIPELRARVLNFLADTPLTGFIASGLGNIQFDAVMKSVGPALFAFSTRIIEFLAYSVAAVFLALYIMVDRERLLRGLFAATPRRSHRRLSRILHNLQTIVGGYIRGQVVTSVLSALYVFIVLAALGVPNAVAIAVFAGIADALPVVGLTLTMILATIAALAKGPVVAAIVFIAILLYEEFEGRVLVPLVYGRALRLPSSVVLFSLLAGGVLGGIIGALLSLPVAAVILMLIEEFGVALPDEESDDSMQAR